MKNVVRMLMVGAAVLAVPMFVRAQTGCVDSPEDPTLVLALVASAGALVAGGRAYFKARKNSGVKNGQI
jgi:XrtJ-associated TM-motif-TM protein